MRPTSGVDMHALSAEAARNRRDRVKRSKFYDRFGYERKTVTACLAYDGMEEELSFPEGAEIDIREVDECGWAFGNTKDQSGWFPLSHVHGGRKLSRQGEPRADVDRSSVTTARDETAAALQDFLGSGSRSTLASLEQRNILPKTPRGASPAVATAQRQLEKENKRRVLGKFFKKSAKERKRRATIASSLPGTPPSPTPTHDGIFGMPLAEVVARGATEIPYVLLSCCAFLDSNAMDCKGIFRISGRQTELDALKAKYHSPEVTEVPLEGENPHVVACVLKEFIRLLPEPLFPCSLYDEYMNASHTTGTAKLRMLKETHDHLPAANERVLSHLFAFLNKIQERASANLMTSSNLGIVFAPSLLYPKIQTIESMTNNSSVVELVTTFIQWGALLPD